MFGSHRFGSRRKEETVYSSGVCADTTCTGMAGMADAVRQVVHPRTAPPKTKTRVDPSRARTVSVPKRRDLLTGILGDITRMRHTQLVTQYSMQESAYEQRRKLVVSGDDLSPGVFMTAPLATRVQSAPVHRSSPLATPQSAHHLARSSTPTLSSPTLYGLEITSNVEQRSSTRSSQSESSIEGDAEDTRSVVGRALVVSPGPRQQRVRSRVLTATRKPVPEDDVTALVTASTGMDVVRLATRPHLCSNCRRILPQGDRVSCENCGICCMTNQYGEANEYEMSQSCQPPSEVLDVLEAKSIKDARSKIDAKESGKSPGKRGRGMAGAVRLASNDAATMLIERSREMAGGKSHLARMLSLNSAIDKQVGEKFGVVCTNIDVAKETRVTAQRMWKVVNTHQKLCTRGCECNVQNMVLLSPQMLAWLLAECTLEELIKDALSRETDSALCTARELQRTKSEVDETLVTARKRWFKRFSQASTILNELLTNPSGQVNSCPAVAPDRRHESLPPLSSASSPPLRVKTALMLRDGSASSNSIASPMAAHPSFIKAALARFPVSQSHVRVAAIRLVSNDDFVSALASDAATRNETAEAIAAAIIYVCSTDARLGILCSQEEATMLCKQLCEQLEGTDTKYLMHLAVAIRSYIRQSQNEPVVAARFK